MKESGELKASPSNPIFNSLKSNTHANPSWNLASQFTMQIFGPMSLTCGCPFIVQGQSLEAVPFGHFPMSLPYLILPTPGIFSYITRTPIIGANSQFLILKQWPEVVPWVRTIVRPG